MRTLKLALFGLGTVGTGVLRLLSERREHLRHHSGVDLQVKWIVVRDIDKAREVPLGGARLTNNYRDAIDDPDIDIGVEVIGGITVAETIVRELLHARKHVVTANKALLATQGRKLFQLAHDQGCVIDFEASVAGGIPLLAAVSQTLLPNMITSVAGILNGTSNFILTSMQERGLGYDTALKQAQEHGFAEADPTLDVDGTDAAQKLALLARLAFHTSVDPSRMRRQGVDTLASADIRYAGELGYIIKLLALAKVHSGELRARVMPTLVRRAHPLAQVRNEYNAVEVIGDAVGDTFFIGKGAGMMPTASSVVANIVDLAIGRSQPTFRASRWWDEQLPGPSFNATAFLPSRFYLRYTIDDRPGTLAQIAGILGSHNASIASVIQHDTSEETVGAAVPLVIMTHQTDEGAVRAALRETDRLEIVREPTVCLPVAE